MEIIKTGTFVSSDYYSTENSPLRSVPRYELELYLGGEGFSVINGVKYPHADEGGSTHFLLARPGDKRFSIGKFECLYVHFKSNEPETTLIPTRIETTAGSRQAGMMREIMELPGLKGLAKLCELVDILSDLPGSARTPVEERYMKQILATKEYMEENFGKKITLDELSKIAYLSKNFYRTVFCRVMETSPREFLRKLRVRKAIWMLEAGELSFGEIAQVCGFENQAYMNCVLKAETGKTPGQIRNGG